MPDKEWEEQNLVKIPMSDLPGTDETWRHPDLHTDGGFDDELGTALPAYGNKLADAAYDYLVRCGLDPNPDAIDQLTEAFLPCLQIICERGYTDPDNPDKHFWQVRGWKGLVHDIIDNAFRLRLFSWERNEFYENGALDIINFAGFYLRAKNRGKKWGEMGEPG